MSDTPRTDVIFDAMMNFESAECHAQQPPSIWDHARALERELATQADTSAALTAELARFRDARMPEEPFVYHCMKGMSVEFIYGANYANLAEADGWKVTPLYDAATRADTLAAISPKC